MRTVIWTIIIGVMATIGWLVFDSKMFFEEKEPLPAARRYADFVSQREERDDDGVTQMVVPEAKDENTDGIHEEKEQQPAEVSGINLAVPFLLQAPEANWDQPWQDACEEATVKMLFAYYNGEEEISIEDGKNAILAMVDWETEKEWEYSISIEKIAALTAWYFAQQEEHVFTPQLIEDPTQKEIKTFLDAGQPVFVVADGQALGNPYFSGDGPEYHTLLIRGYTDSGFITNDPGTRHGEAYVYEYDVLMDAIRDWNEGNVKNGRRVIMVNEKRKIKN